MYTAFVDLAKRDALTLVGGIRRYKKIMTAIFITILRLNARFRVTFYLSYGPVMHN